ncbi:MAG: DUF58 domain-containing protein [Deltaproteobacteria bacterium]|nr:DUF58 domain-containing protein [Deltaproteobacteria bacterium]
MANGGAVKTRSEEILRRVRRIEISTRKIVDTMLSGQYHTRFKGQGMQFSDFREYTPGDDIRHIDWKVTARTQSAHIRKYEEERDLTVYLLVDVSASGIFGSVKKSKIDALAEVCALLSFAAVKNNDRVGLITFAGDVVKHVRPKKGQAHAMRLVTELLHQPPVSGGTNIKAALEYMAEVAKHSCVAFLASDFFDKDYEKALRRVSRRHDVIGLRMRDPREASVPKLGTVELEDAESGELFWVNTSSYPFQESVRKESAAFEKELDEICSRTAMDRLDLWTNEDYFAKVVAYFRVRKRRK